MVIISLPIKALRIWCDLYFYIESHPFVDNNFWTNINPNMSICICYTFLWVFTSFAIDKDNFVLQSKFIKVVTISFTFIK